ETGSMLLHVCGLLILGQSTVPGGSDFERFRGRLGERVSDSPVFRRKVHSPPLNLDHPVWVDDEDFDVERHVHRAVLPAPGGREQLAAVCADIAGQPLDRGRPLWEMWVIEGLAEGRVAVLTKIHHAAVDG